MKIITCPKGGKVPEGYCRKSCLNYPGEVRKSKWTSMRKLTKNFITSAHPEMKISNDGH